MVCVNPWDEPLYTVANAFTVMRMRSKKPLQFNTCT